MAQICFPNPFKQKGYWFKGNIHAHTTNSDGALDARQISVLYESEGYDFLFITDHGKPTDVQALSDSFGEEFLVLPGIELDIGKSEAGTEYHLVGLDIDHPVDAENPQAAIDEVVDEGGQIVVAHPYWSSLTVNDLMKLEGYLGVEIFNTTCHFSVAKGYSTTHWDDLLVRDKFTFGFAVDDAHYHYSSHRPVDAFYSWIMVRAEDLTKGSLMGSLWHGLFYSSNGPEILDVDVSEGSVRVLSSPAAAISFITKNGEGERFTAMNKSIIVAEYKLRGNERYLRIEVEDKKGRTAWTNPISFIGSA